MRGTWGKVRQQLALALAAIVGRASWSDGLGFLPTRRALGLPEGRRGDYCVVAEKTGSEWGEEVLAVDLDERTARVIARHVRNQPGALRRGAHVRNQRTGEHHHYHNGERVEARTM